MKSILFGAAALALSAVTPAIAEDLVATSQWSGAFVGVHAGAGSANREGCGDFGFDVLNSIVLLSVDPIDSCEGAPPELTFDYMQTGYLAGIQGGYNWDAFENFLVGIEVSASMMNLTGELDGAFGGVGTWNSLLTATGKVGFTSDRFLVYGEGGFALAKATFDGDTGCAFDVSHTGPVLGAGVSFKVSDNASIDLKYDHVFAGASQSGCNSTDTVFDPAFISVPTQILSQGGVNVVKVGLNFQLGK